MNKQEIEKLCEVPEELELRKELLELFNKHTNDIETKSIWAGAGFVEIGIAAMKRARYHRIHGRAPSSKIPYPVKISRFIATLLDSVKHPRDIK